MKLVRDKIPKIIEDSGRKCKYHIAKIPEYNLSLYDKVLEEMTEFKEYPCVEEAADIYEVFLALLRNSGIEYQDVKDVAAAKREERGGFSIGYILEEVEKKT
jgi:predicted house-cleaning noncanonical NTP pyrophosphatase (MazG superfamily)